MNAIPRTRTAAPTTVPARSWTRSLRLRMFRRLMPRQRTRRSDVVVRIAETPGERTAAFRLLHDEYVRAGLTEVQESGMRITPYHSIPTTRVFIAVRRGVVVGTLSLIERSFLGVPSERIFDLASLCEQGSILEELSSLAVARSASADGEILFRLFRAVFANSRSRSVKHWVLTCHPRHRHLYEEILGFAPLAQREARGYDFVNGAPAVGAHVDVEDFTRMLAERYGAETPWTPYTWFEGLDEQAFEQVA